MMYCTDSDKNYINLIIAIFVADFYCIKTRQGSAFYAISSLDVTANSNNAVCRNLTKVSRDTKKR